MDKTLPTLIIATDMAHLPQLLSLWDTVSKTEQNAITILVLDAELEFELHQRNIPFRSGRSICKSSQTERYICCEKWANDFLGNIEWKSFSYRNVPLLELFGLSLQMYVCKLLYFIEAFSNVAKEFSDVSQWIVCTSAHAASPRAIVLARHPDGAALRAARHVAMLRGIVFEICTSDEAPSFGARQPLLRALMFQVFSIAVGVLNLVVRISVRPKSQLLFASDYWKHLGPIMAHLPNTELVLYERTEIFAIGIRNIFRHRMQFVHPDSYLTHPEEEKIKTASEKIMEQWRSCRQDTPAFEWLGIEMKPLIIEAFETVFTCALSDAVKSIEATHLIYERLAPQAVLLRASVSNQIHFGVLALLARRENIPSIEIQHGLEYLGPGSVSKRHAAEYIATYGPLINEEFHNLGWDPSHLISAGSPRFDTYSDFSSHVKKEKNNSVLCIAPDVLVGYGFDSYEAIEYYREIASAIRQLPSTPSLVIKLRPGPAQSAFHRRVIQDVFNGISHTIAQQEPLAMLFVQNDVVISCYSTVVLEALQCGIPTVVAAFNPNESFMAQFHFTSYAQAHALMLVHSSASLREALSTILISKKEGEKMREDAHTFMHRQYAFDGTAGERIASFVSSLNKPKL